MNPGEEDEKQIEATLSADGTETVLEIEERGLPIEVVAGHGSGWQTHFEDLAAYLDSRTAR